MKMNDLKMNLQGLKFQRNVFLSLVLLLAVSQCVLSLFLFTKREKVIITPPIVEKEFWIEGNRISPTYLEQYGCFLGQHLLGKSAHSAATQRGILLRNTSAEFVGALKAKLLEEEEMLKKQNASYVFYPTDVKVNVQKREVILIGDRLFFVGGQKVSQESEEYHLSFTQNGSRLLLNGIKAERGSHE